MSLPAIRYPNACEERLQEYDLEVIRALMKVGMKIKSSYG
jgi:hypothetical protein